VIAYLAGILLESEYSRCIIDVNGVGYEVAISLATFDKLPLPGNPVKLHVVTIVREDAISLFGFATPEEKGLFRALLGVSGIGGKLALSILGAMPPANFCGAIASGDVKVLSNIPGIGKRTAERMIVELKGKLSDLPGAAGAAAPTSGAAASDAALALEQLGYKKDAVNRVLNAILEEPDAAKMDSEQLLRAALGRLAF